MKKFPWVMAFILFTSFSWAKTPQWQEKMKSLAGTVGELLPELVSANGDPKKIEKGAKALSELSHSLKEGSKTGKMVPPQDADPSVEFFAEQFSAQSKRAYTAITSGNVEYGKNLLRAVTSYCIACHTRHEKGPEFADFPLNPDTEKLSAEEKARLFIATRQFDKGLASLQKLITDPSFSQSRPFAWEQPVRDALAISVRVKQSPDASLDLVSTALSVQGLPDFQKNRLAIWKQSIENWKKEPLVKTKTEAGLAAEMRKLFNEASTGGAALDHSRDIQYLRASAAAHDLLRTTKDKNLSAEAFLTLGASYEALANPTFWPMHEIYYEACIRKLPHSVLAQNCFSRLEESIYFGYTGSSGTRIPESVAQLLADLKKESANAKGNKKK